MSISPSRQLLVVAVAAFCLCVLTLAQHKSDKETLLSGDFQKFLKDMESKVYKEKAKMKGNLNTPPQVTTLEPKIKKDTNNILRSQKAAISDVLMLKLVSYYEDKYKLSQHDTTYLTTTPSTVSYTTSSTSTPIFTTSTKQLILEVEPLQNKMRSNRVSLLDIGFNDIEDGAEIISS